MLIKATVVWTCSMIISLCVESGRAQKLNVHWGPQSMMYLKGKHGRRFVSEVESNVPKQELPGWNAVLKGIQRLQRLRECCKLSHILSAEKFLIHYLQER